ncbi:hypothetical protein [Brevibacillus porteri]|uniref:hypothetical protein n=1 Tax=Brevibacillus porteri TaxID=2126350 RepID=UPI00362C04A1
MRLKGSKTELDFRQHLSILLSILHENFPKLRTAYVIDWIPEQGEDIYQILVDDNAIAEIELDRHSKTHSRIESVSVAQYKHGLSKENQIRLAVAIDLAQKDFIQ